MLRRTGAGPFTLEGAIPLDRLEEIGQGRALEQILLPMMAGLDDIQALALSPAPSGRLRKGQTLVGHAANHGLTFATDGTDTVALLAFSGTGARVAPGFNT